MVDARPTSGRCAAVGVVAQAGLALGDRCRRRRPRGRRRARSGAGSIHTWIIGDCAPFDRPGAHCPSASVSPATRGPAKQRLSWMCHWVSLPPSSGTSARVSPGSSMNMAATKRFGVTDGVVHERLGEVGVEQPVVGHVGGVEVVLVPERRHHRSTRSPAPRPTRGSANCGSRVSVIDEQVLGCRLLLRGDTGDPAEVDGQRRVVGPGRDSAGRLRRLQAMVGVTLRMAMGSGREHPRDGQAGHQERRPAREQGAAGHGSTPSAEEVDHHGREAHQGQSRRQAVGQLRVLGALQPGHEGDPAHLGQRPPRQHAHLQGGAGDQEEAPSPRQRRRAEAQLGCRHRRERHDRSLVLAVDPDGGGVDGPCAQGRPARHGQPAQPAEHHDGLRWLELLTLYDGCHECEPPLVPSQPTGRSLPDAPALHYRW